MALIDEKTRVVSNEAAGPRLFYLVLESPRIAPLVKPGQFVHLKLNGFGEHILRRPFSVFDTDPEAGTLTILYQVVGEGTRFMAEVRPGHEFDLIGAIGRGWTIPHAGMRVLVVGGGVGAAPLFMLSKQAKEAGASVDVVLGAATKEALVTLPFFQTEHKDAICCATDDGSFGFAGFCTEPTKELLAQNTYDKMFVCGPEPLMRTIAGIAAQAHLACEVSMEKRMACGVGACLSCIVETVEGRKRACVDGPIFEADKVVWS